MNTKYHIVELKVRNLWQNIYMSKKKVRAKRGKTNAKGRRRSSVKTKPLKQNKEDLFGFMAGKFKIVGDIESPLPDWAHCDTEKNL
jgi:hypothetical protein